MKVQETHESVKWCNDCVPYLQLHWVGNTQSESGMILFTPFSYAVSIRQFILEYRNGTEDHPFFPLLVFTFTNPLYGSVSKACFSRTGRGRVGRKLTFP